TGNFTKVVQRIPVKLTFAADNPLHGRIRPGMSVTATVDIRADGR
ncbi:HlyD family secretion protein, partial [Pseudomonas sp. MAFF212427]|nr:HlyD family secretion protein [Pseudomonas brassicae]